MKWEYERIHYPYSWNTMREELLRLARAHTKAVSKAAEEEENAAARQDD